MKSSKTGLKNGGEAPLLPSRLDECETDRLFDVHRRADLMGSDV